MKTGLVLLGVIVLLFWGFQFYLWGIVSDDLVLAERIPPQIPFKLQVLSPISAGEVDFDEKEIDSPEEEEFFEEVNDTNLLDDPNLYGRIRQGGSFEKMSDEDFLFPVPHGVSSDQVWRYSSKNLYWKKKDALFTKFQQFNQSIQLPPKSVEDEVSRVCSILIAKGRGKLCDIFRNCYPNTLQTTVSLLHDATTYIITGDIPLMWMRDSSAQVFQYLPLAKTDPYMQIIFEGLIRRQIQWIKLDPYGSSFRLKLDFDNTGKEILTPWDIETSRTIHVAMHDYEVDSLCSFFKISYKYWKATGLSGVFEEEWLGAAKMIVALWKLEQRHTELSTYRYPTLSRSVGSNTCYTGMTWCAMRPSDDKCTYHYLIPSEMYAVVTLRYLEEILKNFYPSEVGFLKEARTLRTEIDQGIHEFGVMTSPRGKKVYAYEVDGCGNQLFMDDSNVPSLLSMDYLEYTTPLDDGTIARNTYEEVWSKSNSFYHEGSVIRGIGSPHTGSGTVWPMSLIVRAYTSRNVTEVNELINMLERSDAGTNFMHESVDPNSPSRFTRSWFAWANSLFSEMILKRIDDIDPIQ